MQRTSDRGIWCVLPTKSASWGFCEYSIAALYSSLGRERLNRSVILFVTFLFKEESLCEISFQRSCATPILFVSIVDHEDNFAVKNRGKMIYSFFLAKEMSGIKL